MCNCIAKIGKKFEFRINSLKLKNPPSNSLNILKPITFLTAILEKLLTQENRVLEYWTAKKKRLDQTQQYCLFERSARQSLAWIKEEGDHHLLFLTSHFCFLRDLKVT